MYTQRAHLPRRTTCTQRVHLSAEEDYMSCTPPPHILWRFAVCRRICHRKAACISHLYNSQSLRKGSVLELQPIRVVMKKKHLFT